MCVCVCVCVRACVRAQVETASIRPAEFVKRSQLYVGLHCEGLYSADLCWYTARIGDLVCSSVCVAPLILVSSVCVAPLILV